MIYVMRADGGGRRRIVAQPHELALAWSPDGTSIAWVGAPNNGGIHVTSLKTGQTSTLTRHPWDHAPHRR